MLKNKYSAPTGRRSDNKKVKTCMAPSPRYPRPSPVGRLRGRGYKLVVLLLFVRILRRFQQFFSHITTVSGCDRELNAHFHSAASLKYRTPDTWHDTTPSHIILTLGRPVLAPRKSECQARSSLFHF